MFGANVELPCFCCLLDSCCIHLEMSKSKHNLKKSDKGVSSSFIWTDGEFELLLKVTLEYKTSKAIENVDWESCQQKYVEISKLYQDQYPTASSYLKVSGFAVHTVKDLLRIYFFPIWRANSKSSGFAAEFAVFVWTKAVSGKKKLRIQKTPEPCLVNVILIVFYEFN